MLAEVISAGARRLGLMKTAVSSLDARIEALEAERRKADPGTAFALGQQLRALQDERAAGSELLLEAERRVDENAKAFRASEDAAIRDLGNIRKDSIAAAARADRLLNEARAAIDDVERICKPLDLVLLPDGCLKRYCGQATLDLAYRAAFAPRLGRAAQQMERKSFSASIEWLFGIARDNAAHITKARKAAKTGPT